jgi:ribonuclease P protein component
VQNAGITPLRVGIIVPRFVYSAVMRNRVKRRLRELVRTLVLPHANVAAQVVIRARATAYAVNYGVLREELNVLVDQFVNSSRTIS